MQNFNGIIGGNNVRFNRPGAGQNNNIPMAQRINFFRE